MFFSTDLNIDLNHVFFMELVVLLGSGCLSDSFRSESSSPGRAISYYWRAIFRGCFMQGRKTAKGSKNRIENRSHVARKSRMRESMLGGEI